MRNLTISVAFYSKFATFSNFEKIQDFFRKSHLFFFWKNPNFERFEIFHYFSRILRQICYNLMEKNSESWTTDVGSFTRAQLANIGLKNELIWEEDFAFIFLRIWRKIKNASTKSYSSQLRPTQIVICRRLFKFHSPLRQLKNF